MRIKSLVNIVDYDRDDIYRIIKSASKFKQNPDRDLLQGKVCATLFFEPSTRTRLSFETAVNRLRGRIIGFSDSATSSSTKGESLKDTIMMVSNYADLIIMRHHLEGSARYASEISPIPIINAGDGSNQHPTQTMLDLFTIHETQGRLENLTITIVGDLKYGRAVHSLIQGLSHFNPSFNFVAPEELGIPDKYKTFCDNKKITYKEFTEFDPEAISRADILYMTRVQKERFTDLMEYEKVKNVYILRNRMLEDSKENLKVLHPLPRVKEIDQDVDENPKAYYFEQAKNGMYTRQAIICDLMEIEDDMSM
ncbi:MAG: aspartate carbamoyltransferase [Proteiniphilum sp.]